MLEPSQSKRWQKRIIRSITNLWRVFNPVPDSPTNSHEECLYNPSNVWYNAGERQPNSQPTQHVYSTNDSQGDTTMNEDTMVMDQEAPVTTRGKYDEELRRRFRAFARRIAKKSESTWEKVEDDYVLTDPNGNSQRISYNQWLEKDQETPEVAEEVTEVTEDEE